MKNDCGCAQCALDRSRGGKGGPAHEVPKSTAGAAGPTKSKFAALRSKFAADMLPGIKPLPTPSAMGMGSVAISKPANTFAAPATPTSPKATTGAAVAKTSSYQAIRQKMAFSFGGLGKAMGGVSKVLGAVPTGVGNIASAVLGGAGGFLNARAEGHGMGASLLHGAGGATAGIPGGAGFAASMAAPHLINKVVGPPPPRAIGDIGG